MQAKCPDWKGKFGPRGTGRDRRAPPGSAKTERKRRVRGRARASCKACLTRPHGLCATFRSSASTQSHASPCNARLHRPRYPILPSSRILRNSLEVESEAGVVLLDENTRSTLHSLSPDATLLFECQQRARAVWQIERREHRGVKVRVCSSGRGVRSSEEWGSSVRRLVSRVSFESGASG